MSRDAIRAAVLVLVVVAIEACVFGRTSLAAWRKPLFYSGDALAYIAEIKAAQDGHVEPFRSIRIPELNAPFEAEWNDFPSRHATFGWLAGFLARRVGLFPAITAITFLAPAMAALAFYYVARVLRARWEWAMVGALAFALSPFFFFRALVHLALAYYWHLPLCLLVSGWAFSRRGLDSPRRLTLGVVTAVAAGFGSFYYAALFVQLLTGALLAQLLRRRRGRALWRPLVLAALTVGLVALENVHFLLQQWSRGFASGAVTRGYGDVERFALRPLELLLPRPGRGLLDWGSPLSAYWKETVMRGEQGSAYLGLLGAAALAALLLVPLLDACRRKPVRLSAGFLATVWIIAFSVVGGGNGLLSLFLPPWLRATNRFSIALLALALLWAVLVLSRNPWLRAPRARGLVALGLSAFVLADHVPGAVPVPGPGRLRDPDLDAAFTRAVEAALPAGAMLFMLPVQPFPEWPPQWKMRDYEHFRPYFFTTRLRFSYGTDRGRARDEWQGRVAALRVDEMARVLERYGFAGIVLNRDGYADSGEAILEGLRAIDRPATVQVDDLVFVPLRASPRPVTPGPSAGSDVPEDESGRAR